MIAHLLNRTLTVWREELVEDEYGGQIGEWVEQGEVPARVSQPSAAERLAAQQAGAELTNAIYLDSETDVRRGDELREAGEVYQVIATVYPSVAGTYLRADVKRIQPAGGGGE